MAIKDYVQVYPYSKAVRRVGSSTETHTGVQFYSYLQDLADEPGMIGYEEIIKYNTPTSFTMLNGWFLDNGEGSYLLEFLKGASFDTSGYATIDDPVYMLDLDNAPTAYVDFVAGDKDKRIEDDDVQVGPLLAYINDYPDTNTGRIWLRDTRATPAVIADGSKIDMSIDGGTGAGTANGASVSGDEIYCNLYTLADFPSDVSPQVYIYQKHPASTARVRINEWSHLDNWNPGSIDVIIPVKLGGTLIDGGEVKVLVHHTRDTFTFSIVDLSSGSRTPVSTETADDAVNAPKAEWYLLYEGEVGGGFADGDIIQDVATDSGTRPSWYAEVVSVTDWGTTGLLALCNFHNPGGVTDLDDIFVGTTKRGDANGTPGDTYVTYDAFTTAPVDGDRGLPFEGSASTAHRVLRGYQHDGPGGKLVMQVHHDHSTLDSQDYTGSGRDVLYKTLLDNDQLDKPATGTGLMVVTLDADSTTLVSGYSDITVMHINGYVSISGKSGTFQLGERITWNTGSSEARYIADNGTTMYLANVDPADEPDNADSFEGDVSGATANCDSGLTDDNLYGFAFPQQSSNDYSIVIQGGDLYEAGRTLPDIFQYLQYYVGDGRTHDIHTSDGSAITLVAAEEYTKPEDGYTAEKGSPFGHMAGVVFFGPQGLWAEGFASADANNVSFTNDGGTPQIEPYATINLDIGNTREHDVIQIIPRDVASGLADLDQYTSHATNNAQGDSTFEKDSGSFEVDTPDASAFVVSDASKNERHRYRYVSWDTGTLTLPAKVTGVAEAGTSGQTLVDTGVFASGVQRGDIIRNTTDASWGYVVSVDSNDQVTTTKMMDANKANVDWEVGDGFEINALIETYNANDDFYINYRDVIEDTGSDGSPGSDSSSILYSGTPRDVLIKVRNVKYTTEMQPDIATGQITSAGLSYNIPRREDEVYTP